MDWTERPDQARIHELRLQDPARADGLPALVTGTVLAPAHYVHTGLLLPHDMTQDYHSKKDSGIFIIL